MAAPVKYAVEAAASLMIEVKDPDAIERVTGPGGDEWRSRFYGLRTVDDVLEHWAHNALVNGELDVRRLDGWADLAEGAVEITIEEIHLDRWQNP